MIFRRIPAAMALLLLNGAAYAQMGPPASKPSDAATVAGAAEDKNIGQNGSFLSDFTFEPRGRLLFDIVSIDAPAAINRADLGGQSELRRARFGATGKITKRIGYKVEADIAANDFVLTDAFVDYSVGKMKFVLGQHNNFQSMEELSSSNDTSFIERAAFTDAFGFERKLGASAQYHDGAVTAQIGVFTDNLQDLNNDGKDGVSIDGRLVFAPKIGHTQLHFGGSAHWRDLGENDTSLRYRQRPLVHATGTRFIDTGNLANARSQTSYGIEFAAIKGPFHAAAEAHWSKAGLTGANDPTFFGGAIEAGVFLTKHSRRYDRGVFKRPSIKDPLFGGGIGSVQFNVRYDRLDLNDRGIIGGTQDGYMVSLIWSPISNILFMANYARLDYQDAAIAAGANRDYSVDVFGLRTQLTY